MRFSEGLFIDTEKTLGELKFAALRRENYAQDEEGNVTDEVTKRTYDLKCQRQGHTITVSIPPEAGEKDFPYNAAVTLVNPVVSARADATFGGRQRQTGTSMRTISYWQMLQENLLIRQKLPEQTHRKQQIKTKHLIRQQIRPERMRKMEEIKNK